MKDRKKVVQFSELKLNSGPSSEFVFDDLPLDDSVISFLVQFFF